MLTRTLTAFVLAATPQVPALPCTLAGPPVEARWSGAIPPASTAEAPLRVVADVPLPGSASRFDYQSLEPASGRLFISHMGAGQLVVFDVHAGRVIGSLDGFPTVTGVLAVPGEHRAYASATGDHTVVVVDDSTFEIVARVPGPRFPDGIAYAPEQRRGFLFHQAGRGGVLVRGARHHLGGADERTGRGGGRGGVRGAGRLPGAARLVPGAEGSLCRGRSRHAPRLSSARDRERSSRPPGADAERFPLMRRTCLS